MGQANHETCNILYHSRLQYVIIVFKMNMMVFQNDFNQTKRQWLLRQQISTNIYLIFFLFFFSQLSEGSLDENSVVDGSRITLLPRAETGLLVRKYYWFQSKILSNIESSSNDALFHKSKEQISTSESKYSKNLLQISNLKF